MREITAKIKNQLDFEREEIEEEIGSFEIDLELNDKVVIETEYNELWEVNLNPMTQQIEISRYSGM